MQRGKENDGGRGQRQEEPVEKLDAMYETSSSGTSVPYYGHIMGKIWPYNVSGLWISGLILKGNLEYLMTKTEAKDSVVSHVVLAVFQGPKRCILVLLQVLKEAVQVRCLTKLAVVH